MQRAALVYRPSSGARRAVTGASRSTPYAAAPGEEPPMIAAARPVSRS